MMTKRMAAKLSGSHPPSATFHRFARKKLLSTMRENPVTATATAAGQCHNSRMALYSSSVVSNMVVATAVP